MMDHHCQLPLVRSFVHLLGDYLSLNSGEFHSPTWSLLYLIFMQAFINESNAHSTILYVFWSFQYTSILAHTPTLLRYSFLYNNEETNQSNNLMSLPNVYQLILNNICFSLNFTAHDKAPVSDEDLVNDLFI